MRGKESVGINSHTLFRITPAHAGKRDLVISFKLLVWDHPRTCGEKLVFMMKIKKIIGSPPHMRGKVTACMTCIIKQGITPAHAGKRLRLSDSENLNKDHPRTCGEKA